MFVRMYDALLQSIGAVTNVLPYKTLSRLAHTGLVHIAPGENSECIPLSEWLRFSTLFNVLRNIRSVHSCACESLRVFKQHTTNPPFGFLFSLLPLGSTNIICT